MPALTPGELATLDQITAAVDEDEIVWMQQGRDLIAQLGASTAVPRSRGLPFLRVVMATTDLLLGPKFRDQALFDFIMLALRAAWALGLQSGQTNTPTPDQGET